MRTVRGEGGQRQFVLGPVEAALMAAVPVALIAVCAWVVQGAFGKLDDLSKQSSQQAGQLRAMTVQLTAMNATLAGVPQLATQYAELKVRVDNHDEAIRELRQMRGLR